MIAYVKLTWHVSQFWIDWISWWTSSFRTKKGPDLHHHMRLTRVEVTRWWKDNDTPYSEQLLAVETQLLGALPFKKESIEDVSAHLVHRLVEYYAMRAFIIRKLHVSHSFDVNIVSSFFRCAGSGVVYSAQLWKSKFLFQVCSEIYELHSTGS